MLERSQSQIHTDTVSLTRYLPAIGRFLIVVTFLEDALRIITQWSDQLLYLHDYRHSEQCQQRTSRTAQLTRL